jgi:hypothetical protein
MYHQVFSLDVEHVLHHLEEKAAASLEGLVVLEEPSTVSSLVLRPVS